jgi:hypothetical protein
MPTIALFLAMAVTRFYLQSTGTPGITPPFDALWQTTANAQRLPMNTVKQNTPLTFNTFPVTSAISPATNFTLFFQFISAPFATGFSTSQCFFGSRLVMNSQLGSSQVFGLVAAVFKVTDGTGSVVKYRYTSPIGQGSPGFGPPFASPLIYAQLLSTGVFGNISPGAVTNASDTYVIINQTNEHDWIADAVTVSAGDRMIFEIGVWPQQPLGTGGPFTNPIGIEAGDAGGQDIDPAWYGGTLPPAAPTDPTTSNGWVDFVDQSGPNGVASFVTPAGFSNAKHSQ